ncbi:MAG TPA: 50S ribosomal protein L10 [Candidatus Saccharimonadales bacterium]|nr:50S ribosomal protein L10 [Candidatus Saccharimonadales bacterium]
MAISRDKKTELVKELSDILASAKLTAAAKYAGLSVTDMQELRRTARESDVTIKVVKNRLLRVAMEQSAKFKSADKSLLEGQLLYAYSETDEVAPAQVLAKFAKTQPELELVAGFDADGKVLDTAAIKALADLPSKDQLRGQVVGVIAAPLTQMLGALNGAQRGFAQVLSQQAEKTSA